MKYWFVLKSTLIGLLLKNHEIFYSALPLKNILTNVFFMKSMLSCVALCISSLDVRDIIRVVIYDWLVPSCHFCSEASACNSKYPGPQLLGIIASVLLRVADLICQALCLPWHARTVGWERWWVRGGARVVVHELRCTSDSALPVEHEWYFMNECIMWAMTVPAWTLAIKIFHYYIIVLRRLRLNGLNKLKPLYD